VPHSCSETLILIQRPDTTQPNSIIWQAVKALLLRVKTIFPHTAGNNNTLLSFDHGDIITLLIHEEKDGWLYGELEKTQQ
ncbi:hypothetical protein XENOCAPTIV_000103, partial [Xenoophorus captivus]